jgi:CheY-like chemotaxis protein
MAKRELPDVILCDVTMPEKDGYGVFGIPPRRRNNRFHPIHLPHR